ncbi:hypothetical protein AB1Y20_015950 [Prymnesium parvum]|uniref:J domain-containing protein n=1 Tax=Prymnesium parvum TaxID=97485 RepID=A0AB34K2U9_PRYPA
MAVAVPLLALAFLPPPRLAAAAAASPPRLPLPRPRAAAPPRLAADDDLLADDDLWQIVGAPRGAGLQEIRKAYRARARKLHPDLNDAPDAARQFRRLVRAFELLVARESAESAAGGARRNAAERARRAWEEVERRAWGRDAASASERPAGSRREAEARARGASEARRRRWRERLLSEMWREHMPLGFDGSEALRSVFVARVEAVVDELAAGGGRPEAEKKREGAAAASAVAAAAYESWADAEAREARELESIRVREVLEVEMQDARHRLLKHRERIRWLEANVAQAEKRAEMWRGATPASEADRVLAMERELAFLEQAGRLRARLDEQRTCVELLRRREAKLLDLLFASRQGSGRS